MDATNKNHKVALSRNLIHIISRNSNWPVDDIHRVLARNVYAGRDAWRRFLDLFILALGTGFTVAGMIFFFAYNWAEMHPFVKMGIVCTLLAGCVAAAVFLKIPRPAKNTILMGAAFLVGALFAVYGQIYQTGADSWELFAVWTICIAAWVVVANYAPLWLLFLVLFDTTIYLYGTYSHFEIILFSVILFLVNAGFVVSTEALFRRGILKHRPGWLLVTVSLVTAIVTSIVIIANMHQHHCEWLFSILLIITATVYAAAITYSLMKHYLPYLLIIATSVIAILTALLIELIDEPVAATFMAGLFVISCVAMLTRIIYSLNKQWHGAA